MQLGRVIGTVVATIKTPGLEGAKILMLQPLTDKLEPTGGPIAAIDVVEAGQGELVHWTAAREASLALPETFVPVDAAITGIVDDVNVDDQGIKDRDEIFEN
ncbi:MAG: EutN/CcmL family microcompartment protein [Gammaproteobacteria bacterium]|nr:EutN/CcmL family microcompartment protein [Gammaproteobacteria bacterium]